MLTDELKEKIKNMLIEIYEDYKNGKITKESSLSDYYSVYHVGPIKKSLIEDIFSLQDTPNDNYFNQVYEKIEKHRQEAWKIYGASGKQIRCKHCGKLKPSTDFYRRGKLGFQSWCKECFKEYDRFRDETTGEYKDDSEAILSRIKKDISVLRDKYGFKITFTLERTITENY